MTKIKCYEEPDTAFCREPCEKNLVCGHKCTKLCGEACVKDCKVEVESKLSFFLSRPLRNRNICSYFRVNTSLVSVSLLSIVHQKCLFFNQSTFNYGIESQSYLMISQFTSDVLTLTESIVFFD